MGRTKTRKKKGDLCVHRDFCAAHKGIARRDMPQIYNPSAFAKKLRRRGVATRRRCIAAERLRPSQKEINEARVQEIVDELEAGKQEKTTLVTSRDKYIVDGHHRWAAYKIFEPRRCVRVLEVDLPILKALDVARELEQKRETF
jgi:ParB-like nuclease domain